MFARSMALDGACARRVVVDKWCEKVHRPKHCDGHVARARTRVRASPRPGADERTSSTMASMSRAREREADAALGKEPVGGAALGGAKALAWLKDACARAADRVVLETLKGEGSFSFDTFDVTREIAASARGTAPTENVRLALAHRPTTNPMFLRAAYDALSRALGGDSAAKASETWAQLRTSVVLEKNKRKVKAKNAKDDVKNASTSATIDRVSTFVNRGKELLALEREQEIASTSSVRYGDDDASDEYRARDVANGLVVVGATRGADGASLLVFKSFNDKDIPNHALTVGDRVSIDVIGNISDAKPSYDSFDEAEADVAVSTSREATVRFLGDAMDARVSARLHDATSITLEYGERDATGIIRELAGKVLSLARVPDVTTYERQVKALDALMAATAATRSNPACSRVINAVFDASRTAEWRDDDLNSITDVDAATSAAVATVSVESLANIVPLTPSAETFDASQIVASRAASTSKYPVVCIQGPPGTGKTAVVVEIIAQAIARGERVLACAPSNLAVDNLVERLAGVEGVRPVRVGAPERISTAALSSSLDAQVTAHSEAFFAQQRLDSQDAALRLRRMMQRANDGTKMSKAERATLEADIDALKAYQRKLTKTGTKRKKLATSSILRGANVVLATNAGAGADAIQTLPPFDLVVVDEAAQASEPSTWIPLARARRAVLIGDPKQLAPIVRSREAAQAGLARSLMSRLMSKTSTSSPDASESIGVLSVALDTQYRSHEAISSWCSVESYNGRLNAAESVKDGLLCHLPGVLQTPVTTTPMFMLSTRSNGGRVPVECIERRVGGSYINEGEATIVASHVLLLLKSGVKASDIAVISPYAAQVRLLRAVFSSALEDVQDSASVEVSSIDAFQGREAQAVVISMVRANRARDVGFLADARRMNVAVSRAKRHVSIVGDHKTITNDAFLERLVKHIEGVGSFRTNSSYLDAPL
jgi:predicted DNA helicase